MNAEFFEAVADIEKEKGIPKEYMLEKINQALLAALKKDYPAAADCCKVDVDEEPILANRFGIASIPTLLIMKNGEVAEKRVGVTDAATLEALVK